MTRLDILVLFKNPLCSKFYVLLQLSYDTTLKFNLEYFQMLSLNSEQPLIRYPLKNQINTKFVSFEMQFHSPGDDWGFHTGVVCPNTTISKSTKIETRMHLERFSIVGRTHCGAGQQCPGLGYRSASVQTIWNTHKQHYFFLTWEL